MQEHAMKQVRGVASEAVKTKQRNDKLNKEVLEREQAILDQQNKLTIQESDNKILQEKLELANTKLKALESFSSDLQ